MAWPVKVSSIWLLRMPVLRHWAMNRGRACLPMAFIDQSDIGTVMSATSASSGEIVIIIPATPMQQQDRR